MPALRSARIRIEQNTDSTLGADGSPDPVWSVYKVLWAAVVPVTGNERYDTQQMAGEVTHQIEADYVAGITDKMRAVWRTVTATGKPRVFDIKSVINVDERNRDLVMLAVEQT